MKAEVKSKLQAIKVDRIDFNKFNPNRQSEEEFAAHVAEVKRLGQPSKPIVVRLKDSGRFEVVDGEHGLRAAMKAEMNSVLCHIVEVDDFEARRQSFTRNLHGTHDKVLEGRMFREMLAFREMSQRKLAVELGISEGAVRNGLTYAQAADLRTVYAPEQGDSEIANLTLEELRAYLQLSPIIRDRWVDHGAVLGYLRPYVDYDNIRDNIGRVPEAFAKLVGLKGEPFDVSLMRVVELLRNGFCIAKQGCADTEDFLLPIAEFRFPPKTIGLLPTDRESKTVIRPLLSADVWRKILQHVAEGPRGKDGGFGKIQAGVRVALREAGLNPAAVMDSHVLESLQLLDAAPAYIRQAGFLTIEEQVELLQADIPGPTAVAAIIRQVAVAKLGESRTKGGRKKKGPQLTVREALRDAQREVQADGKANAALSANTSEELSVTAITKLASCFLAGETVQGQPAVEVLIERVKGLSDPEQTLIWAALATSSSPRTLATAWLSQILKAKNRSRPKQPPSGDVVENNQGVQAP